MDLLGDLLEKHQWSLITQPDALTLLIYTNINEKNETKTGPSASIKEEGEGLLAGWLQPATVCGICFCVRLPEKLFLLTEFLLTVVTAISHWLWSSIKSQPALQNSTQFWYKPDPDDSWCYNASHPGTLPILSLWYDLDEDFVHVKNWRQRDFFILFRKPFSCYHDYLLHISCCCVFNPSMHLRTLLINLF